MLSAAFHVYSQRKVVSFLLRALQNFHVIHQRLSVDSLEKWLLQHTTVKIVRWCKNTWMKIIWEACSTGNYAVPKICTKQMKRILGCVTIYPIENHWNTYLLHFVVRITVRPELCVLWERFPTTETIANITNHVTGWRFLECNSFRMRKKLGLTMFSEIHFLLRFANYFYLFQA